MQPFYTTLGTEGQRPDGCHTPLCAAGAGPFGNTGKHRPGPDPDRAERRLNPHASQGLVHKKSALRNNLSLSSGTISILVISRCAAPPYPAAPDFLHGKACHTILRSLCSLTNRVPLPPHPGDRINRSMLSCRDMAPWLSTYSAPSKWGWQRNWIHRGALRPANPVTCFPSGKVVAPATKGGLHFRRPQGGCKGFIL